MMGATSNDQPASAPPSVSVDIMPAFINLPSRLPRAHLIVMAAVTHTLGLNATVAKQAVCRAMTASY